MQLYDFRHLWSFAAMIFLCLIMTARPAWSNTNSDLLLVLSADGQSYTAQHMLTTDGTLIELELPAERISLQTHFAGPERLVSTKAFQQNPNRIAITSGSAMTRYQRVNDSDLTLLQNGSVLQHNVDHDRFLNLDDPSTLSFSVTWVLPENAQVRSFTDKRRQVSNGKETPGTWQASDNTLSYTQNNGNTRILSVSFDFVERENLGNSACQTASVTSGKCAPDLDQDSVPDYRDVCLQNADIPDKKLLEADSWGVVEIDAIGCRNAAIIALPDVQFQSGQSYLDVASRSELDRVATALKRVPEQLFEISSHTDNSGGASHNQRLSENRADAVRHYLMLRGVGPNQLNARGYGEKSPLYDNTLAEGRRANRRIELKRLF